MQILSNMMFPWTTQFR